jgi:hypothetical protein
LERTEKEAAAGFARAITPGLEREARDLTTVLLATMEFVFVMLRLDLYGNAPPNHGWMNRFRRWGRSETLLQEYAAQAATFSPAFTTFFEQYLAGTTSTIEEDPIPHPWDLARGLRPPRTHVVTPDRPHEFVRVQPFESLTAATHITGVFLDGGRRETGGHRPADDEDLK